jgi:Rrf2 family nitric oxide-sensitive transcriptional repressor
MQLTRFTDYSIKVLVYLANQPGRWVTIRQISDDYAISRNHLMKVVSFLGAKGYVQSQRGPGGGIKLGKAPSAISLAEVVTDAEGDLALLDCMRADHASLGAYEQRLKSVVNLALQAFIDTLGYHSLADLLDERASATAIVQTA